MFSKSGSVTDEDVTMQDVYSVSALIKTHHIQTFFVNMYVCMYAYMYIHAGFFLEKFSEGAKPTFQEIREVKLKCIKFMQYIHLVHVPLSACLSQRT